MTFPLYINSVHFKEVVRTWVFRIFIVMFFPLINSVRGNNSCLQNVYFTITILLGNPTGLWTFYIDTSVK
jgi:hypothetical protein